MANDHVILTPVAWTCPGEPLSWGTCHSPIYLLIIFTLAENYLSVVVVTITVVTSLSQRPTHQLQLVHSWVLLLFSYDSPQILAEGLSEVFLFSEHSIKAYSFNLRGFNRLLSSILSKWNQSPDKLCSNTKMKMLANSLMYKQYSNRSAVVHPLHFKKQITPMWGNFSLRYSDIYCVIGSQASNAQREQWHKIRKGLSNKLIEWKKDFHIWYQICPFVGK